MHPNIVPMDVDTTTATTNFKKLTPEECTQLAKEGRCFMCHLQGHMAHHCPKNQNTNPHINKVGDTTKTTPTTTKPTTTPPDTMKLTCAQQICTIKEAMEEEECSQYLNSRDMGMDFWSAGA